MSGLGLNKFQFNRMLFELYFKKGSTDFLIKSYTKEIFYIPRIFKPKNN